jgi:dienelactone hydrolase
MFLIKGFTMLKNAFLISISLLLCQFSLSATAAKNQLPHMFYVNIPVQTQDGVGQVSAQYRLPRSENPSPMPAVVILHNSGGVDSTGKFYAKALNNSGIATLELDLWGARGLLGGTDNRPESPQETLPDVFAALHYLVEREEIDAERIGVIGFSWGGVLSMLTATEQYMSMTGTPYRFAGHVAHYPLCWVYNRVPGFEFDNLTGAPVMIQTGALDDYDQPETCPLMVSSLGEVEKDLVELKVYKNAYHAWDRLEPELLVTDPTSHLGTGGEVLLSPNKKIAKRSRRKVVNFFQELFEEN